MNEMKELETLLRSWAPRPPSATLKNRLFPREQTEGHALLSFRWLAPVTAILLLTCILLHQHSLTGVGGSANSRPWVAMVLSNQSAAAYLPGTFQHDQNNLPADTFEWTKGSRFISSIRSLSTLRGTNYQ